jgi:periplasmic protein CpxP/Spy
LESPKTIRGRPDIGFVRRRSGLCGKRLGGELMAQAAPTAPTGATSQQSPRRGPMTNVEARISELHKQLQITPAEEPQFEAYADVMRSNAQMMQNLFQQRAQNPDRTAVGQLSWYAKLTAVHAEAVSKLVAPFEALYQRMSDQQKKVADVVFAQLRQRPTPHRAE